LVLLLPVVLATVATVVSLIVPQSFTATTKLMPPQQNQSIASAVMGQLGGLASMAGKDVGLRNPSDIYTPMLRSRTIADRLIERFDLMKVYKSKLHEQARETLASMTDVVVGKEGTVSISVKDHSPQRSADLANGYVEELHKLTQNLAVTEAGHRRIFFEREVETAKDELAKAEENLKRTQENTGLVQLDGQAKAMIESIAAAKARVAAQEVQVQTMRSYATAQNPALMRAEQELSAMRGELARLEGNQAANSAVDLPIRKVPEAGLEYLRRVREVKYRESLLELLIKQYEAARVDEAKEAVVVQVLDKAYPPEIRSWPHRSLLVAEAGFGGFALAVALAFLLEAADRARKNLFFAARVDLLKFYLFNWREA
ncbi:MAG: chain length determinant family protein, partial [Acidobacteriaceae bacterium]|nr:chain length determinant family protein [Acidobacteriaceae bacterium]